MTETPARLSAADETRVRRRRRRAAKAEMREACFQALADGFTHQQIAEARGVSVATIRREIDRALAARRVEAPEKHIRLQIARATKALALLDIRLSRGEMKAVGPFLKTLAALDRYHGFDASPALAAPPRPAQARLAAPPLALTHAVAATAFVFEETTKVGRDEA